MVKNKRLFKIKSISNQDTNMPPTPLMTKSTGSLARKWRKIRKRCSSFSSTGDANISDDKTTQQISSNASYVDGTYGNNLGISRSKSISDHTGLTNNKDGVFSDEHEEANTSSRSYYDSECKYNNIVYIFPNVW